MDHRRARPARAAAVQQLLVNHKTSGAKQYCLLWGFSDVACGQGAGHGARSAKGVGPALRRILRGQRQHRLRAGAVRSLRKSVSGLASCCVGGVLARVPVPCTCIAHGRDGNNSYLVQRSCSTIPATHASLGSGASLGPADHHTHRARAASRRTSRTSCPTEREQFRQTSRPNVPQLHKAAAPQPWAQVKRP